MSSIYKFILLEVHKLVQSALAIDLIKKNIIFLIFKVIAANR